MTCGPDDFNDRHYVLRPTLYNRQTELMIVVTMYVPLARCSLFTLDDK